VGRRRILLEGESKRFLLPQKSSSRNRARSPIPEFSPFFSNSPKRFAAWIRRAGYNNHSIKVHCMFEEKAP